MSIPAALLNILIFPGLLYALPAGWLMVWLERKTAARLQRRIGPPFFQPFFDFIKLLAKRSLSRPGLEGSLISALPVLATGALIGALALLPVFPQSPGFAGDAILLVGLLELPAICSVLAGFVSRSLYGQVGAAREAVLSLGYNLPFLMGIVALAYSAGSLRLGDLAQADIGFIRWLALLAILMSLPARLRINPFSLPNAEQEIYAGPLTEFGGPALALWELAHCLEWVVMTGLVASLAFPRSGLWMADGLIFTAVSLLLALALAVLAAATARLKVVHAMRFYGRWGAVMGSLALIAAALAGLGG